MQESLSLGAWTFGRFAVLLWAMCVMAGQCAAADTNAADVDAEIHGSGALTVITNEIRPNEPMRIVVHRPEHLVPEAMLLLVWMTPDGQRLNERPILVVPGEVNLSERLPALHDRREVSFVQLFADRDPIGAAVVIQPILSPLVPMTVERLRVDGSVYPHVVGWRTAEEAAALERDRGRSRVSDDDDDDSEARDGESQLNDDEPDPAEHEETDRGRRAAEALADPARELRGFRLYREKDVKIETSFGEIRIALRPDSAPETAWRFRGLVDRGSYDGLTFHRIVPMTVAAAPFAIQGGCPRGDGRGGNDSGNPFPLEPSAIEHDFGVISMARGDGPDSAGTQFFIALSREGTAQLDGQFCSFGYAIAGREAILSIADVPLIDPRRGVPEEPVVIHRASLVSAPPRVLGTGRPDSRVLRDPPPPDRRDATSGRIPR
jgi:peptidyl-prolyl cis-trans isomerase B (cyclophilin B)